MNKSLISKLQQIKKQKYRPKDFIIADAKDGDMAMGIITPGPERDKKGKILKKYKKLDQTILYHFDFLLSKKIKPNKNLFGSISQLK